MAESNVEVEALARLEAALDRISQRGPLGIPPAPAVAPNEAASVAIVADTAAQDAISARLDALIAQLHAALEGGHASLED